MIRHRSETALAILTLFAAATHFTLETWYHLTWGQPLQALLVDYICNALMLLGGMRSLIVRPGSAAGLLVAGWAYALGFGWRSVFGRLEAMSNGIRAANGEPTGTIVIVLLVALGIVAVVLLWALALAWRQSAKTGV
ncbi:hypothetical protein HZY97_05150 [Sphingomonas sp. R-74633]|uniref:hypothetical protein n=1 Tax=Sphingomonas sp. R-74633 TaxID=2751188 RepID=UPI0015D170D2|nr:hypothetical protein [Sphingomonas sp. R-74633]NYT40132.1 hypothetical protein [Sphingomonas sp. R-74633]